MTQDDTQSSLGADSRENSELPNETEAETAAFAARGAKAGLRGGAVFSLFLLAGLGGAAGGWALSHHFPPKAAKASGPDIDLTPIEQRLERAEKTLEGQKAQLSRLTAEMRSGPATISLGAKPNKTADLQPLITRLERLEATAGDTGANTAGNTGGAKAGLSEMGGETAVETNSEAGSETKSESGSDAGFEAASTNSIAPPVDDLPAIDFAPDIEALSVRVAALEAGAELARTQMSAPTIIKDTVLLPPFPRAAVLAAMTSGGAAAPQSWLDKTLKKHISVRDPEQVARANSMLDEIEKNIKTGEHARALKGVEALPSQARSAAKNWIEAVRREVKG